MVWENKSHYLILKRNFRQFTVRHIVQDIARKPPTVKFIRIRSHNYDLFSTLNPEYGRKCLLKGLTTPRTDKAITHFLFLETWIHHWSPSSGRVLTPSYELFPTMNTLIGGTSNTRILCCQGHKFLGRGLGVLSIPCWGDAGPFGNDAGCRTRDRFHVPFALCNLR